MNIRDICNEAIQRSTSHNEFPFGISDSDYKERANLKLIEALETLGDIKDIKVSNASSELDNLPYVIGYTNSDYVRLNSQSLLKSCSDTLMLEASNNTLFYELMNRYLGITNIRDIIPHIQGNAQLYSDAHGEQFIGFIIEGRDIVKCYIRDIKPNIRGTNSMSSFSSLIDEDGAEYHELKPSGSISFGDDTEPEYNDIKPKASVSFDSEPRQEYHELRPTGKISFGNDTSDLSTGSNSSYNTPTMNNHYSKEYLEVETVINNIIDVYNTARIGDCDIREAMQLEKDYNSYIDELSEISEKTIDGVSGLFLINKLVDTSSNCSFTDIEELLDEVPRALILLANKLM